MLGSKMLDRRRGTLNRRSFCDLHNDSLPLSQLVAHFERKRYYLYLPFLIVTVSMYEQRKLAHL